MQNLLGAKAGKSLFSIRKANVFCVCSVYAFCNRVSLFMSNLLNSLSTASDFVPPATGDFQGGDRTAEAQN